MAERTPWLPKFNVDALLMMHDAVIVICTVNVVVVVVASDVLPPTNKLAAATANVNALRALDKIGTIRDTTWLERI